MAKKLVIGITGGIGAGKSIVSDLIEKSGFPVLRSDLIAKELMISDTSIKKNLADEFGEEIVKDGKLDTKLLAKFVFGNDASLQLINSIVHPPTLKFIDDEIKKLHKKFNIVFVESALIYEAEFEDMFDYIILVYSSEQTRIERVTSRDMVSVNDVKMRMKHQISDEKKKEIADFVIENNSDEIELKVKIEFILKILSTFVL